MTVKTADYIDHLNPITGLDLRGIALALKARTGAEAAQLFGITPMEYARLSQSPEPVRDVAVAIVARLLMSHPQLAQLFVEVPMVEVWQSVKNEEPRMTARRLGLLMGRSVGAAYRWIAPPSEEDAARGSIEGDAPIGGAAVLRRMLQMSSHPPKPMPLAELIHAMREAAETEAAARGINDLWRDCTWFPGKTGKRRGRWAKRDAELAAKAAAAAAAEAGLDAEQVDADAALEGAVEAGMGADKPKTKRGRKPKAVAA